MKAKITFPLYRAQDKCEIDFASIVKLRSQLEILHGYLARKWPNVEEAVVVVEELQRQFEV